MELDLNSGVLAQDVSEENLVCCLEIVLVTFCEGKHLIVGGLQFRGLVHYHHGGTW